MRRQVFISYRRDDDAGDTGRLYDRLREHFDVWFDVKSIKLAEDFPTAIGRAVGACDALIVVIGRHWLPGPATDDPDDFVRVEVASALDRGIPVFPVLVDGATMPEPADLPPTLAPLATRHALELSRSRFDYDLGLLVGAIEQVPRRRRTLPGWAKAAIAAAGAVAVLGGAALASGVLTGSSTTTTVVEPSTSTSPVTTATTTTTTRATTTTTTTALVTVPNVVGFTAANAKATLENAGFQVVQVTQLSSAKAGSVVSTTPTGGSKAAKGSTVTVRVSSGSTVTFFTTP